MTGKTGNCTYAYNTIWKNTTTGGPGIQIYGNGSKIEHNTIFVGWQAWSTGMTIFGCYVTIESNHIVQIGTESTYGISMVAGTHYCTVRFNDVRGLWTPISPSTGTDNVFQQNRGFVTENSVSLVVANNENVPHGLVGTPDYITVTCGNATYGGVPIIVGYDITGVDAINIPVTVYWSNGTAITDDVIFVTVIAIYKP